MFPGKNIIILNGRILYIIRPYTTIPAVIM